MEPLITDEKPRYARLHGDDENVPENPEALALIRKWKRRFYVLLASSLSFITIIFGVGVYSILSLQDSPAPVQYVNKWLTGDPDTKKFMGKPRPELDQAWHDLLDSTLIKYSADELFLANNATSVQHKDGGFVGGLGISHSLHCLKRLKQYIHRDYYYDHETQDWDELYSHVDHCLESLRQEILCNADVNVYTLKWTPHSRFKPTVKVPQPHACVDWEALHGWMKGRQARLEDMVGPPESLFEGKDSKEKGAMSANDYYHNTNSSTSHTSGDTQQTSNQSHSSHSYPPQGQTQLHSYDNHGNHHGHFQLQDHAGRRRSSAISIPAGAAGVSLNPHLAQGSFLQHQVPNNTPAAANANFNCTSSGSGSGHPNTSHFCPVGHESTATTKHGINGNGPDTLHHPDGPDGERGLGATLVGGASGHFLAHQLGHGHHGVVGSTAGAVAANLLEHQLKKSHNQHAHDLGHSGGGGGLSGMFGGSNGGHHGGHHTLQQQTQQHQYPTTHAGSGGHGHGHGYEYEYGDDHGQGGVNQGGYGHGKHHKWGL
ncbi:hypothetical protein SMACR_05618 [Sordaria macrospora]|uniref:WGS project CABT00000000 data, contig 2.30 n=2 Tax=Sordaria macrospora TaxID=5147 RepID=F7W568_SORMK|nr:uncharacterized protein SMAC_05618 [Sordaria macrospora k-hell]KAA8630544.1 hypothetical protein SMACR_05618 [Sordaria macrospora]WPJ62511.1 hypothetical protein SMAC4_05618 [Sordaria macrospora]CCC12656.1 unnamed protein product [Sordaria macrospora k-hell]